MSKQREVFEAALDAIGGTIHVFSAARAFTQPRYLEGVTEVCWRTWQAAWQASRAATLEEAVAVCDRLSASLGDLANPSDCAAAIRALKEQS